MARFSRKQLKKDEIVEAAFDFGHWIEANWPVVLKWAGAVVVLAAIVGGWLFYAQHRAAEAARKLADAERRFQQAESAGSTDTAALNEAVGLFDEVIESGGDSSPVQIARYYRGAALHRLGRFEEAIASLEAVSGKADNPTTLMASAESLLAAVYVAAGRADDAIALLTEASEAGSGHLPSDQALLQLGRIHKSLGDDAAAREAWQGLVDRFGQTSAANEASRLLGLQG